MHRKTLVLVLVGLLAVILAPSALAAKSPHRYSPRHGAKCRKGYKRVVKRQVAHRHRRHARRHKHTGRRRHVKRKVFCVKRHKRTRSFATRPAISTASPSSSPAPTATAEEVKLHAHLDPTYTRNPLDPFEVTYAYSASASQEVQGFAVQEAAPLPSGVLALFSDGKLECAINVGSGVEGSECPVNYEALGEHTVTTIYSSGEESATETEVENIEPLATTTTLEVSYEPLAEAEADFGCGEMPLCHIEAGREGSHGLTLGTLSVHAETSLPSAEPASVCMAESCVDVDLDIEGNASLSVAVSATYTVAEDTKLAIGESLPISEGEVTGCVEIKTLWGCNGAHQAEQVEAGTFSMRVVSPSRAGYASSEATAPIQFTPTVGDSVRRVVGAG